MVRHGRPQNEHARKIPRDMRRRRGRHVGRTASSRTTRHKSSLDPDYTGRGVRIFMRAAFGFSVCAGSRAVIATPLARPQRTLASTTGIAILRVAKSAFAYKIRPERHAPLARGATRHTPSGNLISRGVVKNIRAADTWRPFRLSNGAIWVPDRRVKARYAPLISHFGPTEGQFLDRNQATGATETRGARHSVRRATIFDHQRINYY